MEGKAMLGWRSLADYDLLLTRNDSCFNIFMLCLHCGKTIGAICCPLVIVYI